MKKLTIVVSYYKALENLKLILEALNNQSCSDFEVIISEDDNSKELIQFLENEHANFKFPIKHINQKVDDGFRKNEMLNRAILTSSTEKIAFIDGDCVPHKHFAKQYIKEINKGCVCVGRAVLLDEKITESIKKDCSFNRLKFGSLIFSKTEKKKEGVYFPIFSLSHKLRGLVGRNWGCCRQDLIDVNGFDEDYVFAGVGEDVDVEWRLIKNGLTKKSVKNKAIVYHLYHKRWYQTEKERENFKMMQTKISENHCKCLNGIEKLSQ